MPTPSPQKGPTRLRTRCVLWHAPGSAVPPNLGSSLTARPVDVLTCDNPYAALAAVCAASETTRPTLLVLIEPASLPHAVRVLVLAEQFVPHAARWAYEASAEVKLRAVTPAMVANLVRTAPVPVATVVAARSGSVTATVGAPNGVHGEMGRASPAIPALREPGASAQKLPNAMGREDATMALGLSAEELAMLLAEAPENLGGGGGGVSNRAAPPSGPGASR